MDFPFSFPFLLFFSLSPFFFLRLSLSFSLFYFTFCSLLYGYYSYKSEGYVSKWLHVLNASLRSEAKNGFEFTVPA
jgi:hypothetical protein